MDKQGYSKVLQKHVDSQARCRHCGSNIIFWQGEESICSFCEAFFSPGERMEGGRLDSFSELQELYDSKKFDDAIKKADSLALNNVDPHTLYGLGAIYAALSDIKYYGMDYGLQGFMEQNAVNSRSSLGLTAKSKEMFFKSIYLLGKEVMDSDSSDLIYLRFMANIKLGRLVDAKKDLGLMNTKGLKGEYVRMVYAAETRDKTAYEQINKFIKKGDVNSVFYLAKHYADIKKLEEAKTILDKLVASERMPMAMPLLKRVEKILEQTTL